MPTPAGIMMAKRVFMVFSNRSGAAIPIGTAFGINCPGTVVTAAHVVADEPQIDLVCTAYESLKYIPVREVRFHKKADVALLITQPVPGLEWFELGVPSDGTTDFPLGEEVEAYGFPMIGTEKPIPPRLMQGHIQCKMNRRTDCYTYSAYELSFPAFHNLSGSPVFRSYARQEVVGVITDSTAYSSESHGSATHASWSLAAAMPPLNDWVHQVVRHVSQCSAPEVGGGV